MAPPLRIGAGVIGIVVPSRHGIRVLQAVINAPIAFETTITDNVGSDDRTLGLLQAVKHIDWELVGDGFPGESKAAVQTPRIACDLSHSCMMVLLCFRHHYATIEEDFRYEV
jgi:hypothetical protein